MEFITRREFIKYTITGLALSKSINRNVALGDPAADMSRIVTIRHPQATDGVRKINAGNVQIMMDEAIKILTDKPTVADAWASLLPGYKKEHLVAIKANCVNGMLPTHLEVVEAITNGLIEAGVTENNIIVYDIVKWCLLQSRYKYNMSDVGVRYFATMKDNLVDEDGWGADRDNPLDILGKRMFLSTIVTRCDHLINVPVLKAHWCGFTLSLKNHYGSLGNDPQVLHDNINLAIPILNSHEAIKNKTRIVIADALFGCWRGPLEPPDFVGNGLIVSKDPVAVDCLGSEMINKERAKLKVGLVNMDFMLQKAAEMGLGTNDHGKMEKIEIEMKAEEGKSVNPGAKYNAEWGRIKNQ